MVAVFVEMGTKTSHQVGSNSTGCARLTGPQQTLKDRPSFFHSLLVDSTAVKLERTWYMGIPKMGRVHTLIGLSRWWRKLFERLSTHALA